MFKKYMHENLKHTVLKNLAKKIKKYSPFQAITTNNSKYVSDSYQAILTLSWSYSQTILHFFPDIKQYLHFQRVTGKQYFRVYIKQYWHFQKVPPKLNHSKNVFQST